MRHFHLFVTLAAFTILSASSFASDTLNIIEFVVLDKSSKKPVSFSVDMSEVPNKIPFFAELSDKDPSRITWAGPADLPISLDAKGYESITIDAASISSFEKITTAPRSKNVVTLLMTPITP